MGKIGYGGGSSGSEGGIGGLRKNGVCMFIIFFRRVGGFVLG